MPWVHVTLDVCRFSHGRPPGRSRWRLWQQRHVCQRSCWKRRRRWYTATLVGLTYTPTFLHCSCSCPLGYTAIASSNATRTRLRSRAWHRAVKAQQLVNRELKECVFYTHCCWILEKCNVFSMVAVACAGACCGGAGAHRAHAEQFLCSHGVAGFTKQRSNTDARHS